MPRIETDIKLDYKDVLIRPKRSTLKSRSQVSVTRTVHFKNANVSWTGVPIMAANMDTVGTFEMAKVLGEMQWITCIHKHYSEEDWGKFCKDNQAILKYVAVSAGTSEKDLVKTSAILKSNPEIPFICLDVANGY